MLFCTVQDIADFLQIEVDEPAAMRAITEATIAIKNYCHQEIELVEDDEITLDVGERKTKLFLPELPVVELSEVIEDGELLTEDDDYKLGQWGILYRMPSGAIWAEGIQIVTMIYTHGYAEIPQDIVSVCTRAASRAYQAGLLSADSEGVPGIASKALGDFSVSFQPSGSEGTMGASAARFLLQSEKDLLNRYR